MNLKLRTKPIEFEVIQWENNEAEIREFVQDDRVLKFPDNKLMIWDNETLEWKKVPMFHYVAKLSTGNLRSISPESKDRHHDLVG